MKSEPIPESSKLRAMRVIFGVAVVRERSVDLKVSLCCYSRPGEWGAQERCFCVNSFYSRGVRYPRGPRRGQEDTLRPTFLPLAVRANPDWSILLDRRTPRAMSFGMSVPGKRAFRRIRPMLPQGEDPRSSSERSEVILTPARA